MHESTATFSTAIIAHGVNLALDGRWSMVDGRWSMVDGRWSKVVLSSSAHV
ncbi:MAG: hypothetical protein ABI551_19175 [Polyangiaceae bacterium]